MPHAMIVGEPDGADAAGVRLSRNGVLRPHPPYPAPQAYRDGVDSASDLQHRPRPLGETDRGSSGARRQVLPFVIVAVLAGIGLTWAKWWPYSGKTLDLLHGSGWSGAPLTDAAQQSGSWWEAGLHFTGVYTLAVWKALAVALVLAAALQAVLGTERLASVIDGRPGGSRHGTVRAVAAGLPTMMCTCCTAPVAVGLRRSGASVSSTTAFWLTNPVLNPAVIVFLALVGPWEWAAVRIVVGVLLIAAASAVAGRLADRPAVPATALPEPLAPGMTERSPVQLGSSVRISTGRHTVGGPGVRHAVARFGRELGRLVLVLVPEYLVLVFAVGAITAATGMSVAEVQWSPVTVLVFAVVAVLFVVPTGGEIPFLLALMAAHAGPWPTGIALICLSAVSLPSLVMVGRSLTWRAAALTAVLVTIAGIAAGALLAV